jgi:hypothetical protein
MKRAEGEPAECSAEILLCRTLGGFEDLSPRFANAAIARIGAEFGSLMVQNLLARFAEAGAQAVMQDPALRDAVRQLLLFLYTGFTEAMGDDSGSPENHFESLMWRAALAHPPALSGAYFGHWHYPPEDAHG